MKGLLWNYIKEKMLETPHNTVTENGATMTYEELCIYAEHFAERLTGPYYGIFCQSEMASAMSLLACFAANKPAIPMPTRYGGDIYRKILDEADPPYVITDIAGELCALYMDPKTQCRFTKKPAVILYTSGSTGTPKGVMLSEENIIANLKDIMTYLPIDSKDTFLISRPLYHSSVLTGEFLLSLCNGANIVFYSQSFCPSNIIKLIRDKKITATGSTPTLMSTLARFCRKDSISTVKKLTVSGECMTEGMAKQIRVAFPNAKVFFGYGLSEASPRIAYLPPDLFDKYPTSAGIVLPSVETKIVDKRGLDVADGEVGELLVRGPNVMIGYFKNRAKTKSVLKEGWLSTGDLALKNNEGLLYIKGRKDDMIIRAGMNIYPAEIENALSADKRVEELLVYGYYDGTTQQIGIKIKGDFICREEVFKLCREKLPPYQIPNKIEIENEIVGGPSGKKKRKY